MRLLFVIPHYFGPADPAHPQYQTLGSHIEPLSRIAALSDTIASLHRNFGPYRSTAEGLEIPAIRDGKPEIVDIVIVTKERANILPQLGLDPSIYTVEYFDGRPAYIPFHVPRVMKERQDRYDFYCYIEDDLAIHDPDFFDKLIWFQRNFGPRTLLAPTRVETASSGTPGKVIIDPVLSSDTCTRFRRPGQREELQAAWGGRKRVFRLPSNPHAAAYFLTREQLAHWIRQPTFDDHDDTWVGPLESAATLAIGKVFDIYKSVEPDPFFLEVHHFGTSYAARNPPHGRRYGEPPLLAIAQGATRTLNGHGEQQHAAGFGAWMQTWVDQGCAGEAVGRLLREAYELGLQVSALTDFTEKQKDQIASVASEAASRTAESAALKDEVKSLTERVDQLALDRSALEEQVAAAARDGELHHHSLRWMARAALREAALRVRRRIGRS
jgi:polyhydroxyalkanoate synthesis regulator phasin